MSMRRLAAFLFIASIACLAGQPALADKRVAFVIGNSSYQNVGALTNPANDATAITEVSAVPGGKSAYLRTNSAVSR